MDSDTHQKAGTRGAHNGPETAPGIERGSSDPVSNNVPLRAPADLSVVRG